MKLFFILSYARSGSTIFRQCLNSHSQLVVPPECGYLHWIPQHLGLVNTVGNYYTALVTAKKIETWNVQLSDFAKGRMNEEISFIEFVEDFINHYSGHEEWKILGDKNNYYLDYVPDLINYYPEANFIILIRHPLDILQSFVSLQKLRLKEKYSPSLMTNPAALLEDYKTKYETAQRALTQLDKKRTLLVRYEDFTANQESTFRDVQDFLGVEQEDLVNGHLKDLTEPEEFNSWKQRSRSQIEKIPNTILLQDDLSDKFTMCYREMVRTYNDIQT